MYDPATGQMSPAEPSPPRAEPVTEATAATTSTREQSVPEREGDKREGDKRDGDERAENSQAPAEQSDQRQFEHEDVERERAQSESAAHTTALETTAHSCVEHENAGLRGSDCEPETRAIATVRDDDGKDVPLTSNRAWGHAPRRAQRLIGLDGLRALAVLTVMAFHFQVPGFSGGFLGVDMFFVLSGYLITSQLWTRWAPGKLAFGKFWTARVRRLAPAVLILIATTILATAIWHPQGLALQLKDSLAAVTYTSNWWYIFGGRPYGDFGNWWFLEHLWSLAIEEQFYVIWPLVVAAGLYAVKAKQTRRKVMIGIALGGALISTILMTVYAFTYGGEGNVDPSRQYFGTDSHAMGLLIGAALAFYLDGAGFKGGARELPKASTKLTVAGALAVAASLLTMLTVEFSDLGLYRYGGFLLFSVIVATAVAAAAHPGPLANVLGNRVLRYVGDRSYGLYLWHWPLVTLPWVGDAMRRNWVVPAICLTVFTFVVAELSYRFVEMPVRRNGLRNTLLRRRDESVASTSNTASNTTTNKASNTMTSDKPTSNNTTSAAATAAQRFTARPVLAGALTVLLLGGIFTAYRALAPQPCDAACEQQKKVAATMEELKKKDAERAKQNPSAGKSSEPTVSASKPAVTGIDRKATKDLTISVWGDSVADAIAVDQMPHAFKTVTNNAVVAQQANVVLNRLMAAHRAGLLTQDVVLIHTGDNGFVDKDQLQNAVNQLKSQHTIILVTPKTTIPEGIQARKVISQVAKDNAADPKVKFVDWYAASKDHPEYFVDGVHLTSKAEPVYIDLLQKALGRK